MANGQHNNQKMPTKTRALDANNAAVTAVELPSPTLQFPIKIKSEMSIATRKMASSEKFNAGRRQITDAGTDVEWNEGDRHISSGREILTDTANNSACSGIITDAAYDGEGEGIEGYRPDGIKNISSAGRGII